MGACPPTSQCRSPRGELPPLGALYDRQYRAQRRAGTEHVRVSHSIAHALDAFAFRAVFATEECAAILEPMADNSRPAMTPPFAELLRIGV
jgi:hypothetical protein